MNVSQLIDILSKLNPQAEVGLSQWKPPHYTEWELLPVGYTMVDANGAPTNLPSRTVKLAFHRK